MGLFGSAPADCDPAKPRTVEFPSGLAMGVLWARKLGTPGVSGWSQLGEAKGKIQVAAGQELMLQIKPESRPDLSPLARFKASDLHTLDLWDTKIEDKDLAQIAGLAGLRALSLSRTQIGDAGLAHLAGLSNLATLNLYGTKITDAGLARVSGLPAIEVLWINKTAVTDACLAHLRPLAKLRELYVADTKISEPARAAFKREKPACQIRGGKGSIWSY